MDNMHEIMAMLARYPLGLLAVIFGGMMWRVVAKRTEPVKPVGVWHFLHVNLVAIFYGVAMLLATLALAVELLTV